MIGYRIYSFCNKDLMNAAAPSFLSTKSCLLTMIFLWKLSSFVSGRSDSQMIYGPPRILLLEREGRQLSKFVSSEQLHLQERRTHFNQSSQARQQEGRKLAGGPGSAPPNCVSKCGQCIPCKPVHVPIQPGNNSVGVREYYPEAWRCKCGNKLYMP